jgi:hypothetical protein
MIDGVTRSRSQRTMPVRTIHQASDPSHTP